MRPIITALFALPLSVPLFPTAARADTHESIHRAFTAMEAFTQEFVSRAQEAITIGGAIVSQNRYAISGGALGCAWGATAGASSAAALALPTGGASVAAAPNAMAAGCALGTLGGVALGYQLDHPGGP